MSAFMKIIAACAVTASAIRVKPFDGESTVANAVPRAMHKIGKHGLVGAIARQVTGNPEQTEHRDMSSSNFSDTSSVSTADTEFDFQNLQSRMGAFSDAKKKQLNEEAKQVKAFDLSKAGPKGNAILAAQANKHTKAK